MTNRKKSLQDLIEFRKPPAEMRAILAEFEWDCDQELVQLERRHVIFVLKRFVAGEILSEKVEAWTNLIECRDDVDYEEVKEVLHILANPLITYELTPSVAVSMIEKLMDA